MHDNVVDTAARALSGHGYEVVRFNFRGVGASAGQYDNGVGEVDDLRAVLDWAGQQSPQQLIAGGYSFGSHVAWRAAADYALARLLLIAPPIGMMDFTAADPGCPTHVFAGDADEFIDAAALDAWEVDKHVISGANHFFMGAHDALFTALNGVLD